MFSELMNFLNGENQKAIDEKDVMHQKFQRIHGNRNVAPTAPRTTDASLNVIRPHHRLISHWTETAQAEVEQNKFYEPEPHVMQLINNSGTLMQPGSAELFLACKPHPLDELNERRRKAEELDTTRRFFQYSKLVKNSA